MASKKPQTAKHTIELDSGNKFSELSDTSFLFFFVKKKKFRKKPHNLQPTQNNFFSPPFFSEQKQSVKE